MKKIRLSTALIVTILLAVIVAGCNHITDQSITMTFDEQGRLVQQIISYSSKDLSTVGAIVESTKNKSWVRWHSGTIVWFEVSPGNSDDPSVHIKTLFGNYDDGIAMILKDQQNCDGIAKIVMACRKDATTVNAGLTGVDISQEKSAAEDKAREMLKAPAQPKAPAKVNPVAPVQPAPVKIVAAPPVK